MAFTTHLLVVANRTVDAPEVLDALVQRAERGPIHVTLLMPVPWPERESAGRRMQHAIDALDVAGIPAVGMVGDADPICAVQDVWHPARFDEVIVATFAEGASRWLQVDLPHRVARLTDCQIRHVVVPVKRPDESAPMPPRARRPLLESVLALMRTSTRSPGRLTQPR